jgi:cellulase/cellobiase CelA1
MAKKHTRRVSLFAAIDLHAEANKSDPFAAKRMAMTLRNRNDKPKEVAEEAQRLLNNRTARIKRYGSADWLSVEQVIALNDLRADMRNSKAFRRYKVAA